MIVRDDKGLWYDWGIRFPANGLDPRTLSQGGKRISLVDNEMRYVTGHSMAGGLWAITERVRSLIGRLESLTGAERAEVMTALERQSWEWRNPSRPSTAWHDTVLSRTDNGLIQHAPINWRLAHGHAANPYSCGVEIEGLMSTHGPADPWQVETLMRMERDLAAHFGRSFRRATGGWHQHGEHGPTGCPEGRYSTLYEAWARMEEDDVDEATVRKLIRDEVPAIVRAVIADEAIEVDDPLRTGGAATNTLLRAAGDDNRLRRERIAAMVAEELKKEK